MKIKKKQLYSSIVLIVVLIALGGYLYLNKQSLSLLYNISFVYIILVAVLRLFYIATNGLFLRAFAGKFGVGLRFNEWFGLAVVTTMSNYITPLSGGVVIRAVYLKERYTFPYSQFVTLLAANYLVTFWVIGIVGTLLSIMFFEQMSFSWLVLLLFLSIVAFILILVLLPAIHLPQNKSRFNKAINSSLAGWATVKSDKILLTKLVLYTLGNVFLNGFSFWLAYRALDLHVSFSAALFISLLTSLSILIQITPGNIGIRESIVGISSALLGIGVAEGLLVGLVIRVSTILVAFTLGPIFSYILTRDLTA